MPPLFSCNLPQGFGPRAGKHPRLGRVPRVAGVVGELVGAAHTMDTVNLALHELDAFGRLLVLNTNAAIDLDDRDGRRRPLSRNLG